MSFSITTMKTSDWKKVKFFSQGEFKNPDEMGYEFVLWLDRVREMAHVPMHITSDYRSSAHNESVGGAKDSAHCDVPCNAVDIGPVPRTDDPNWNHTRFQVIWAALALGCRRIGLYPNGSIHLDRSEAKRPSERIWIAVDNPAKAK